MFVASWVRLYVILNGERKSKITVHRPDTPDVERTLSSYRSDSGNQPSRLGSDRRLVDRSKSDIKIAVESQ